MLVKIDKERTSMKITAIENNRLEEFPNILSVRVHTDEGLVGLSEIFYDVTAAEAHIHGLVGKQILGRNRFY